MIETLTALDLNTTQYRQKLDVVYVITHKPTGLKYVGSTSRVLQRWKQHCHELYRGIHHCKPLQALFKDEHDFYLQAFTVPSDSNSLTLEQALMDHYRKDNLLINTDRNAFREKIVKGPPKSEAHWAALKKARQTSNAGAPKKKVLIRGKQYNSVREASRQVHEAYTVVQRRLNDQRFPDYTYIEPS